MQMTRCPQILEGMCDAVMNAKLKILQVPDRQVRREHLGGNLIWRSGLAIGPL
jgi:hypothetical protein